MSNEFRNHISIDIEVSNMVLSSVAGWTRVSDQVVLICEEQQIHRDDPADRAGSTVIWLVESSLSRRRINESSPVPSDIH